MTNELAQGLTPLFFPGTETPLTPEERARLVPRLMKLLDQQIRLQTQGDSVSVREEDAAELLDSVGFTLRFYLDQAHLPTRTLLSADLPELFGCAKKALISELEKTESLYRLVMRDANDFGNRSLRDTLDGIGPFFRKYDVRLYAHQIPAQIDYQLCFPVPETLRGVIYIREYLLRFDTENTLLTRFDSRRVHALLHRYCADYRDFPTNLYEPVAAVTVGLALAGGGETLLELSEPQAARIAAELAALSPAQAQAKLTSAAKTACSTLRLGASSQAYLAHAASELYPRLSASAQSYRGVFYPLGQADGNACKP